ncbi:MAG: hypothetical protein MJZ32_12715 [Bacteroidaceae bacterium]|nr:hypothetical protein [Bacteroidaceae bacterium]
MSKYINNDYIGVVRQKLNDKFLDYVQVYINKRFSELSSILDDMKENDNRNVFDLQTAFTRIIPQNGSPKYFNFCLPRSYKSSYIGAIYYPEILKYDEYQKQIKEYREIQEKSVKSSFEYMCDPEGAMRDLKNRVHNFIHNFKIKFHDAAIKYINAYQYYLTLENLQRENINKMFSSENIGWTVYNYPINKDLTFTVRSNFGYGSSSYFYVNLKYKGIDILPYSDVVKYYYANMQDFVRYTRLYEPDRSSWDIALSFVVDTSNEAIANKEEFIKKWIMNEVEEMVSGLNRLETNPTAYYKSIIDIKREKQNLICFRNVLPEEINEYKVYPNESVVAYQAEKISGALLLLEKLSKLTTIYPDVTKTIVRIKDMNQGLLPKFRSTKKEIEIELEKRREVVNKLEKEVEQLNESIKPHEEAIKKLFEIAKKENPATFDIRRNYESKNPDYAMTKKKIDDIRRNIDEKKMDIRKRNNFANRLSECINRIVQYVTNVA